MNDENQKTIENLKKEILKYEANSKLKLRKYLPLIIALVINLIGVPALVSNTFNIGLAGTTMITLACLPFFIVVSGEIISFKEKEEKSDYEGKKLQLELLTEKMKEKELSSDLDKEKSKQSTLDELKYQRELLALFYEIGSRKEEYLHSYEEGHLESDLKTYYDKDAIEEAEKYFEEHGPELTRKK